MRLKIASPLRTLASAALGMACGYLVWVPMLSLPEEWSRSLAQLGVLLIKATASHFSIELVEDVKLALAMFFQVVPNTLAVAVLAMLIIRAIGNQRLFVYSVLVWPAVLHAFHWFYVWYIERVAVSVGANPQLASFRENYFYPSKAVSIALIYSLFLSVVFLLSRISPHYTHNPSIDPDAAR
jgi:hypothetical protein